ncbi:hypothetical protein ACFE04_001923 [Oxalis oulophora]
MSSNIRHKKISPVKKAWKRANTVVESKIDKSTILGIPFPLYWLQPRHHRFWRRRINYQRRLESYGPLCRFRKMLKRSKQHQLECHDDHDQCPYDKLQKDETTQPDDMEPVTTNNKVKKSKLSCVFAKGKEYIGKMKKKFKCEKKI